MILDTVAAAIHENQIDLTVLEGQLDFNAKFGENLDRFFQLFRFSRQSATFAEGYVTFGRQSPANQDIQIPVGTLVMAPAVDAIADGLEAGAATFSTIFAGVLTAGETETAPIPVRATVAGAGGNVSAGRVTTFVNEPVIGITTVTNEQPFSKGRSEESDDEFKVRFKNTVFRNLAGTQDQYLALAMSLAYSTKANVVGPISRYREYIQVPPVADNASYDVDLSGVVDADEAGGGIAGEYTTAMTTNPYAQHVWTDIPYFVSNGDPGVSAVFYRADTDFVLNSASSVKNKGDALRFFNASLDTDPRSQANIQRPNVTFYNVYTGSDVEVNAIRPDDIVLLEYSYMSDASRNSFENKILNCVDVFVNGENPTVADCVIPRPSSGFVVVNNPTSKYHFENFRRAGEPEHRPLLGNAITPLYWEPVIDLPESIEVETDTDTFVYTRGIHYWLVEDVSEYGGTVRARSGIEWATGIGGEADEDEEDGPYTGPYITDLASDISVPIEQYTYDRNIIDLQTSLEANKQITTDVLAHRARNRYFKFDITVMYTPGAAQAATNQAIYDAVRAWFGNQSFGTVVQLSDVLQVIHGVGGVDNVRWSSDVPGGNDANRVIECDYQGNPRLGAIIDRRTMNNHGNSTEEVQQLILTGGPTGGTFTLTYDDESYVAAYNVNAATLDTQITTIVDTAVTVTGTGTYADPFLIAWDATTALGRELITVSANNLTGGDTIYDSDFILKDNELPALPTAAQTGDSVPGFIIRPRAQHTWIRR
jgi:uncharacterized phage protein gp47/JayE